MTFSIVARTSDSLLFGVAIASSSPAVAARCAWARAGVGAVATQNITDPALAPEVLDELERGADAVPAVSRVLACNPYGAYRQLLAVGRRGAPAVHSGAHALGTAATSVSAHAAAAGNLLALSAVPEVMTRVFEAQEGGLPERLLTALRSGARRGGEAGPIHSAGLLVVRDLAWPLVDLRVDWSDTDPIGELEALWLRYAPQMEDYVIRALNPQQAPPFGVPGDP